jgi:hypothetical protein
MTEPPNQQQEATFGTDHIVYLNPLLNIISYLTLCLDRKTRKKTVIYDHDTHMADKAYMLGVWEKSTANGGEFPPITTILKGMPSSSRCVLGD